MRTDLTLDELAEIAETLDAFVRAQEILEEPVNERGAIDKLDRLDAILSRRPASRMVTRVLDVRCAKILQDS